MEATALLIIDMQQAFFADDTLKTQQKQLVENINELSHATRHAWMPVFMVRTEHTQYSMASWSLNMRDDNRGFLFTGSEGTRVVDGLDTEKTVDVVKTRDSAFFSTSLASMLHTFGIKTVILSGVSTQSCIFQTAADAYAHGFRVTIADDAIATNQSKFHDASLDILQTEYRQTISSTQEIVKMMEKEAGKKV